MSIVRDSIPSASITEVKKVMAEQDRILHEFPEVEEVVGKLGRAETATDPAPVSMIETTITLKPEHLWRPGMTRDQLISDMTDAVSHIPGFTPAFLQPIQNRVLMLNTGRLQVLAEVIRRGSFSAAADALSYTQSAIRQQIAALERETRATLIERDRKRARLTEAGEMLLAHAGAILGEIEHAERDLGAYVEARAGRLRLAAFESAGAALVRRGRSSGRCPGEPAHA